MKKTWKIWFAVGVLLSAASAPAANFDFEDRTRTGSFALDGSIGFTLSPDAFLLGMAADYYPIHSLAFGPLLQMGVSDDIFLLAPTFEVKGIFDLPAGGFARRVKPVVQGGAGFVYANVDRGNVHDDDIDFMFNMGFGADIYLTTHFALGNHMLFNVVPARVMGDRFFFSWQFVSAKYLF